MANDRSNSARQSGPRVDEPTGTETVGHEWDGIEELDTPMPRWWLWTLYATIVWGIVYVILYPAWPMIDKASEGVLGWTSRGQLAEETSAADLAQQSFKEQLAAIDVVKLQDNPDLLRKAVAGGAAAFKVHCSQCHGSGAAGSQTLGYPNLNDDAWIWGGDLKSIYTTIDEGIRQSGSEHRKSAMPPFAGVFDDPQLTALVSHVQSLNGKDRSNATGATLFSDNCTSCHGPTGGGNRELGVPDLSDAIWLRGGSPEAIRAQILDPKMGVMPAWGDRLDDPTVKMLTAYVYSLGGGEDIAEAEAEAEAEAAPMVASDEQP